ncbi:hypothetical protein DVH05_024111 [Phytophthora capsici]|nr:hypothetical protein DVH05_024111 [Phytophthora capsici]
MAEQQQQTTGSNSSATATSPPAARAHTRLMDDELKPWQLYDLSGAVAPDSPDTMKDFFRRFRNLRGKSLEGFDNDALARSWSAFIKRWNRMQREGSSFVSWLTFREKISADHSISALRNHICENAWDVDRLCYVHVREGCKSCNSVERPSEAEWQEHVAEWPLSEQERAWIAKYDRTLSEMAQSSNRGGSRRRRSRRSMSPPSIPGGRHSRGARRSRSRSRSPRDGPRPYSTSGDRHRSLQSRPARRSRSRSRSPRDGPRPYSASGDRLRNLEPRPAHREEGWREAPTYPRMEGSRANEPYICARSEPRGWRSNETWMREEDPRAQRYGPRSTAYHPSSQQAGEDQRADTARALVAQGDMDDVASRAYDAQLEAEAASERAARAEGTATALRQSNRELLERMRSLEQRVFGGAQTGTHPRERVPGSDGSMARQARRAGRSMYAAPRQGME